MPDFFGEARKRYGPVFRAVHELSCMAQAPNQVIAYRRYSNSGQKKLASTRCGA
jgi:hypothetical protein